MGDADGEGVEVGEIQSIQSGAHPPHTPLVGVPLAHIARREHAIIEGLSIF